MKKALPYILHSLVIAAVIGLLIYQGLIVKTLETGNLVKGLLIIAAALVSMFRPKQRRKVSNKKVLYKKAYGHFIGNAFSEEPKLEKKFFNAVDDYNFGRNAAGIQKLEQLRSECRNSTEIYAVTVFTALCYDNMNAFEEAIRHYDAAVRIRDDGTLHSNAGLCWQRLGKPEEAEICYRKAIASDSENPNPWNNLSALYFKQGQYDQALEYAEAALAVDARMPQALSCAAVCTALLGRNEEYENYYRRAVAAGYDGKKIKNVIQALNPEI